MQICDDGHEEIVYDGRDCPLCYELDEKHQLEKKMEALVDENDKLNEQLEKK